MYHMYMHTVVQTYRIKYTCTLEKANLVKFQAI